MSALLPVLLPLEVMHDVRHGGRSVVDIFRGSKRSCRELTRHALGKHADIMGNLDECLHSCVEVLECLRHSSCDTLSHFVDAENRRRQEHCPDLVRSGLCFTMPLIVHSWSLLGVLGITPGCFAKQGEGDRCQGANARGVFLSARPEKQSPSM